MKPQSTPPPLGAVQVPKDHYFSDDYLGPARFSGLHAQLQACRRLGLHNRFLEIGPGPDLLGALLRRLGGRLTTVDFAADLAPSVVGRLPHLPLAARSFDVVCAFEVLEHIPLELLTPCLLEMRRVARTHLIISVPDQHALRPAFGLKVFGGRRGAKTLLWRQPLRRLTNAREHYWEVGHAGITPRVVNDHARAAGLIPVSDYFVEPWFHFFELAVPV